MDSREGLQGFLELYVFKDIVMGVFCQTWELHVPRRILLHGIAPHSEELKALGRKYKVKLL